MSGMMRTIVLWCPDWPIIAAARSRGLAVDVPLALVEKGTVFASSTAARREGVRRGVRVREAQARCPELVVVPYEAAIDMRCFGPVIEAIEETVPGVQVLRPGTCAMRARGPARYYGGEHEAGRWILDALARLGIEDARVGIADGPFTAERAARSVTESRVVIVPEGGSSGFLAPLPVELLADSALVGLLRRLGINTLGDFARLPAADVEARFGADGAWLHSLACGHDSRPVIPRVIPDEFDGVVEFEPSLDRADQITFGFRTAAEQFISRMVEAKLVCTAVRVEVTSESGELSQRSWLHPRSFTATDVLDRIRWQVEAGSVAGSVAGRGLTAGVTRVRVVPEAVDAISHHEVGLWGEAADERVHHGLSRVQSMLGHGGVLTAVIGGGRRMTDRQILVPWGDRPPTAPANQPWPGQLPNPAPSRVFAVRLRATVISATGQTVDVDGRGQLTAAPTRLGIEGHPLRDVSAWAGPWPVDERWWDSTQSYRANRFQLVDETGVAWLLVLDDHLWWVEAGYD
jgi:protein ImuB